jgi:hypothetical protein
MKNLICKKITLLLLMMTTLSISHASDLFSHTVLILPDDPRTEEPWKKIINTQEDWESFFYARTAYTTYLQGQAPIAMEIDFEKYQVLAGGLGEKPHGHSLSVEQVIELENEIHVVVLDIQPGLDCVRAFIPLEPSYPSATVLVKRTGKPFKFIVSRLIEECS